MKYISNCEKDTYEIGKKLAENLKPGDVIAFYGDLGAGKTAFTKGVCAKFGIEDVHSPTFTIVNEYNGDVTVFHFDAYRIDGDSWINGGFDEYLFAGGICVIEWAENLDDVLPKNTIKVTISRNLSNGDDYRDIEVLI